jgi:hypothetical protein
MARWRGLFALLLVLALAGCGSDPPADPGPGAAKARMEQYVEALDRNSATELAAIVGRPADSDDVTGRLRAFGGRSLSGVVVSVTNEFPRIYHTNVLAKDGAGAEVRFAQVIEWQDGKFDFAPYTT